MPTISDAWLLDSIVALGYEQNANCMLPNGIRDTLIQGNTDRVDGIFHRKESRFKTLKISGASFEKQGEMWTNHIYFFRFDFEDKAEEKQFEDFQNMCGNYQMHGKNQVSFFRKNSVWYLRFVPMP